MVLIAIAAWMVNFTNRILISCLVCGHPPYSESSARTQVESISLKAHTPYGYHRFLNERCLRKVLVVDPFTLLLLTFSVDVPPPPLLLKPVPDILRIS